jgi:hypothetical protein
MTIPTTGVISLNDIQTEFGGTNPISISEYYAGGSFVASTVTGTSGAIPSSGQFSLSAFYGSYVAAGYAYYGPVNSSSSTVSIVKIKFPSESITSFSTTFMPSSRFSNSGCNSTTAGYSAGEDFTVPSPYVMRSAKLLFSSDSASAISLSIGTARSVVSTSSTTTGYWAGGVTPSGTISNSQISGVVYSTDTSFSPINSLSLTSWWQTGLSSSTTGYWAGGNSTQTGGLTGVNTLNFSSNARSFINSRLSYGVRNCGGTNGTTKGYIAGGSRSGQTLPTNEIMGFTYSTETGSTLAAVLSVARMSTGGPRSESKAYLSGGTTGTTSQGIPSNALDILIFSNDSMQVGSYSLPFSVAWTSSFQNGGLI